MVRGYALNNYGIKKWKRNIEKQNHGHGVMLDEKADPFGCILASLECQRVLRNREPDRIRSLAYSGSYLRG